MIYRLFSSCGGVAHYIREQRLRRCFADLVSDRGYDKQVAAIAWHWGFTDAAHFSRIFKERFGCTPTEARAGTQSAARQRGVPFDTRVGDRHYEDWIAGLA